MTSCLFSSFFLVLYLVCNHGVSSVCFARFSLRADGIWCFNDRLWSGKHFCRGSLEFVRWFWNLGWHLGKQKHSANYRPLPLLTIFMCSLGECYSRSRSAEHKPTLVGDRDYLRLGSACPRCKNYAPINSKLQHPPGQGNPWYVNF